MISRFRSRSAPAIAAAAFGLALVAAGAAEARQASQGTAPVSSGEIVTGLAKGHKRPNARSKVSPTQPAPAEPVEQPSAKLKSDPNVAKEQVAPIPAKPVPPGTRVPVDKPHS